MQTLKCVVIGDDSNEKNVFLVSYTNGDHPSEYVPTVFDNYCTNVVVDGKSYRLGLWDTSGQEEYDKLRPLSYPQTDVFIILFSINSPPSFQNVIKKWYPEINHHCPTVPFLLVTANVELRDDKTAIEKCQKKYHRGLVTKEEGEQLAQVIGAYGYYECSSATRQGLIHVFEEAVRAGSKYVPRRTGRKRSLSLITFFKKDKKIEDDGDKPKHGALSPVLSPRVKPNQNLLAPAPLFHEKPTPIKCVVVGDKGSGKTAFLISFTRNTLPPRYIPSVFDNFCKIVSVDNKLYDLGLWDTAGQEEYPKLRPLSYLNTNVFIIMFAVDSPPTFETIKSTWFPEVRNYSPKVPILLVTGNVEVRDEKDAEDKCQKKYGRGLITSEEGEELANYIGAYGYYECSSASQKGLTKVFEEAIHAVVHPKKKESTKKRPHSPVASSRKEKNKKDEESGEKAKQPSPTISPRSTKKHEVSGTPIKCVVAGDVWEGKTGFLTAFTTGNCPMEYAPSVFDNYCANITVDKKLYNLVLWDTSGQEDYDQLRPLSYPQTDVFIILFPVDCPPSFWNASIRWFPEIRYYCKRTPVLLVTSNVELRDDKNALEKCQQKYKRGLITKEEGEQLAKDLGAYGYYECSSVTQKGLNNVFEEAVRAAAHPKKKESEKKRTLSPVRFFKRDKKKKTDPGEKSKPGTLSPVISSKPSPPKSDVPAVPKPSLDVPERSTERGFPVKKEKHEKKLEEEQTLAKTFKLSYAKENESTDSKWSNTLRVIQSCKWDESPVKMRQVSICVDDDRVFEHHCRQFNKNAVNATNSLVFCPNGEPIPVNKEIRVTIKLSNTDKAQGYSFKIIQTNNAKFQCRCIPSEGFLNNDNSDIDVVIQIRMLCSANIDLHIPVVIWKGGLDDADEVVLCEESKSSETTHVCYLDGKINSKPSTRLDLEEIEFYEPRASSGSYCSVYRGSYHGLRVNCMLVDKQKDNDEQEMIALSLYEEVERLESLRHPCIVTFIGAVVVPEAMIIVTELNEYGSLGSALKKYGPKVWGLKLKLKALYDVARAMDFLHQSGIAYQHLNTECVLVTCLEPNAPVVCKLGGFKKEFCGEVNVPLFTAPELLTEPAAFNHRVDVYSFGIIMACVADNGRTPYEDVDTRNSSEFCKMVLEGLRPEIMREELMPSQFISLMYACWERDPRERPEFSDALLQLELMLEPIVDTL